MERVLVDDDAAGLAVMLADLIRANIERDPAREKLLDESGTVNLAVTDAEVEVGMVFAGGTLSIGSPVPDPDLTFECESEVLMTLTHVPLRFGMPDQLTKEGRMVASWLLNGTLKVQGIPRHLPLMIRLQRLFTVSV